MQTRSALFALSMAACGSSTKPAPASPSDPAASEQGSAAHDESGPPGDSHERMTSIAPEALAWAPIAGTPDIESAKTPGGMFVKIQPGRTATRPAADSDEHAIVVAGTVTTARSIKQAGAPLGPGSYWFHAAGAPLAVTCGKDVACVFYVHAVTKGTSGHAGFIEKSASDATWTPLDPATPALGSRAPLWGDDATGSGMLVKMPAGSPEHWHIHKAPYHAVVLAGTVANVESGAQPTELPTGAYWSQPGGYKHSETCKAGGPECLVYVHHAGAYLMKPM